MGKRPMNRKVYVNLLQQIDIARNCMCDLLSVAGHESAEEIETLICQISKFIERSEKKLRNIDMEEEEE